MKIITDQNKIQEILTKGVERVYPDKESLEKVLLSGKKIKLYCGYDPTAPSLHLGNAITLRKLAQFQSLGHGVIMLIGDFTAMIGDPTDKTAARQKLTRAQVNNNLKDYQAQASKILKFDGPNPAKIIFNNEWHNKMTFADLIEIASNFTVGQMIIRDMFQKRIADDKPIYLHEFLYPLAQAYDSVAMDVDLELGGNDQTFNMMCGRDLMKTLKNKEKFVLTMKLLTDAGGKKMGKTEGNMLNLNESSDQMFGKVMSWSDSMIVPGFELCTNLSLAEIQKVKQDLESDKVNPRDLKARLAFEIVKELQGEEAAQKAQEQFDKVFSKKQAPDEIKTIKLNQAQMPLVEILIATKLAKSKSDAQRLIEQKSVRVGGVVIDNWQKMIDIKGEILIQKGKRFFVKIKI